MEFNLLNQTLQLIVTLFLIMSSTSASAAAGDILFTDNFERAVLAPNWTVDVATAAGINTDTFNSPTRSLFTRHQTVFVTSSIIDITVPGADLSYWVRRGQDTFSEDPDTGEDLVIEYLDSVGTWITVVTFPGKGTPGEILAGSAPLPFSALHANFQLRISQTGGSGFDFDYWHIDDIVVTETSASRPPLALGTCDDFEQGLPNWTITSGGGGAGISTATFQSSASSMFTNAGVVTVTSNVIDTSNPLFDSVSMWIRRGADAFSEDPDGGENLIVEYLNNTLTWVALETFSGAGGQGQIFIRDYALGAAARHAVFQLRFRQIAGNNGIFDFWHIDDVCLEGSSALPTLTVLKTVVLEDDPVNATAPKSIPLSNSIYTIRVSNAGFGSPDNNTLFISNALPAELELFTGNYNAGAPYEMIDGTGADASGVSCAFIALGDATDCVTFLNSSSVAITPNGTYDPAVRTIEFRPSGTMNPSVGANTPFFDLVFRVRVQ